MSQMTDDTFSRLVAEEVKGKVSPAQREFLMMQENWERWLDALEDLIENLNGQLLKIDEDEQLELIRLKAMGKVGAEIAAGMISDANERRKRVKRFLFFVEQRFAEVETLLNGNDDSADDDRLASFYRRAIEKHRELTEKFDMESTPVDLALYRAIDGHWDFDAIKASDFDA